MWLSRSGVSIVRVHQRWIDHQWNSPHRSNARLHWPCQPDILFLCLFVWGFVFSFHLATFILNSMPLYVCHQVPRPVLALIFNIMLPLPREGEDEHRPPTALELCATYACKTISPLLTDSIEQSDSFNRYLCSALVIEKSFDDCQD